MARITDDQRDTILALRQGGMTFAQIGERLGIAKSTAKHVCDAAQRLETNQTPVADPATANPTEQTEATLRALVSSYAAMIPDTAARLHRAICEDRNANEAKALTLALAVMQDKQTKAEQDLATFEARKAAKDVAEFDWETDELPTNVVPITDGANTKTGTST